MCKENRLYRLAVFALRLLFEKIGGELSSPFELNFFVHYCPPLFMISRSFEDFEAAVDLLGEHNPCKMMRKGHFAHAKAHVRALLYFRRQAERAADDKAQPSPSGNGKFVYPPRKILAFKLPALDPHCNNVSVLTYCTLNISGFLIQRRGYLLI